MDNLKNSISREYSSHGNQTLRPTQELSNITDEQGRNNTSFPFKSTNCGQSNQSKWRHHGGEDCGGKGVEKSNTQVRSCGSSNRRVQKSRMSKTEDKGDEKAFYMKGESSRGGYNFSRGRANSNRGGRDQGRSNQADCYNKQREESQTNHVEEKDKQSTLFMTSNLIDKVYASDIREFGGKLESPPIIVEELLLSQERQLTHFISDQGTSNVSSLSRFMQDHEAEGPEKVVSAAQNEEVTLTPMVDCNGESVIEETSSPKKKIEHPFSVIKKSIKAKEAEPKSDEPDSNTPVP
jgi:hypothetical protein